MIAVNWPHHVFVNKDFKVIGAEEAPGLASAVGRIRVSKF